MFDSKRMKTAAPYLGAVAGACLLGAGTAQAGVIDTVAGWNGTDTISPFGETNTATYGQTFTVSAGAHLKEITFYLNDFLNPDFVDFEAYVYAWDGSKASGGALFSAGPFSTTNNGGADGMEAFTVNPGITLGAGVYVAFLSASNLFDGSFGTSNWILRNDNPYAGGNFVYLNNGASFGDITTDAWSQFADSDVGIIIDVPEPAGLGLMGLGLLGLGFAGRRRKAA